MDFVYICRDGENEELRYSIRSVLNVFPGSNIIVYGGKPGWYKGEFFAVQSKSNKFANITSCYREIALNDNLSDFILMNDDFFILGPGKIDFFYDGLMEEKINNHINTYGPSRYTKVLRDAKKALNRIGIADPLNYDVHLPMPMNKEKLASVVDLSDAPRSMYGNVHNVGGIKVEDVKIYKKEKEYSPGDFISSIDEYFPHILQTIIKESLNRPTTYEAY